jgi:GAF domain-containing protein
MKRAVRLREVLEEAARLKKAARPPTDPVSGMLAIVRQKMDAEAAALVLISARSCRLITSALAGDADERLDVGVRSTCGETAVGQDGAIAADIPPMVLAVTKRLRASGIRSLLGIRLSAGRLWGTLYVGLGANRRFTAAEIERVEMFGAVLSINLDNAQRYAALQNPVDELTKELAGPLVHEANRDLPGRRVATAAPRQRAHYKCPRRRSRSGMHIGR